MMAANNQDVFGHGADMQDGANVSTNSETKRKFAKNYPADGPLAKEMEAKSLAETRLILEQNYMN